MGRRSEEPSLATEGLRALLQRLDGAPYPSYRRLVGRHDLGEFSVIVDGVPADPFAGAARVRVQVERAKAALPRHLVDSRERHVAVEDYLARVAAEALEEQSSASSNAPPGSGRVFIEPCGAAIIERSSCRIGERTIELRVFVDLPAAGRMVRGIGAEEIFFSKLVRLATSTLLFSSHRLEEARRHADLAEDHAALQAGLARRGLVAFIADGSLLARTGRVRDAPRRDGREVPFEAPASLAVYMDLPRAGKVRGMGVPAGVTLIVGGAFHGKSTLLHAIASGVDPHPPGDGRERVATVRDAVGVRGEDGRPVKRVDLSSFLTELPTEDVPADFSTDRADRISSQAAAVVEALEAGAGCLLVDEDTSAPSFLSRDGRMQQLLPRPGEPIVPLLDRLRELHERFHMSAVVATGAAGDYFQVADTVILMRDHRAEDATARAREIVLSTSDTRLREPAPAMAPPARREPYLDPPRLAHLLRTGLAGPSGIRIGDELVDLTALAQILEPGQLRALALLMRQAADRMVPGKDLAALVLELDQWLEQAGLDALDPPAAYDLARPRRFEVAAVLSRWRSLRFHRPDR